MTIHLVHHADAVSPAVDPQRPLSELGWRQAEWLASAARVQGVKPDVVWHSGKLRARQTAECMLRACNPFAAFRMVKGLRPEDSPDWIRDLLEFEDSDVLAVGHMPNIAQLSLLLGAAEVISPHGIISLERTGERQYAERWRAKPVFE